MAILRDVKVQWASVLEPNTQFDHQWEIQATFNSDEQAKAFVNESKGVDPKGKGVKLKEDQDGNKTFRFRRRVARADGNGDNSPPAVCGPGGKDDIWTKKIGNGSVCNIQYAFSKYDNKFGKGVTTDLKGVQVLVHVPFGVQDGEEFNSVEAVSAPKAPQSSSNEFDDEDF